MINRATGMPALDAREDFTRARRAARAARASGWISRGRGRGRVLRTPDEAGVPWGAARLQVIPLREIAGTVEPTLSFDSEFRPASDLVRTRWVSIALAHRRGVALPPIELRREGDGYYVVDGRHRVSVARALGLQDIAAWVTCVRSIGSAAA